MSAEPRRYRYRASSGHRCESAEYRYRDHRAPAVESLDDVDVGIPGAGMP